MPDLLVVAGPNGSGKSTLTRNIWLSHFDIIDPDAIARAISSASVTEAARYALKRRQAALNANRPHLLETTLSGSGVLRHMKAARKAGFCIELHYVCLDSPNLSVHRIRNRVNFGGHDVPEADVRRRYKRSQDNLPLAISQSDVVRLYDNTDSERYFREIAMLANTVWTTSPPLPSWAKIAIARSSM